LVLEGGVLPEDITPRPPFEAIQKGKRWLLHHKPKLGGRGELTILGGLKTKDVDVVVTKPDIGPVIAVSLKGTLNAFRNLTNRMEEAVGDCTNLHISYPALVYGFLHVLRANCEAPGVPPNDVVLHSDGTVSLAIQRYHDVLARLYGRRDLRDDPTKYEAIALALVEAAEPCTGLVYTRFPESRSPLSLSHFFETLYMQYDQRFVYSAPSLAKVTRRVEWAAESPAFQDARASDYATRTADDKLDELLEEVDESEPEAPQK
jgi:hypothetical protein